MSNKEKLKLTLQDILKYIGFAMAAITIVVYLVILYIIVFGFENSVSSDKLIFFLLLNNIAGILISIGLRIQGVDLAKNTKVAKDTIKEYSDLLVTDKSVKLRPLWVFHMVNIIKDIFTKGVITFFTLYFTITVIIYGLGDAKYFVLGFANIFMYVGFGLIALSKAYEHYIERQIPFLKQKINKMKEEQNGNFKTDTGPDRQRRTGTSSNRSSQEGGGVLISGPEHLNGSTDNIGREIQNS